jgi:hypothetical protein
VLSNKMLNEVVFPVTSVIAIRNLTCPVLQLPVPFVLVPDPVGLAFEGLGLTTVRECASERLYILVDVLCPIRGLVELLDLEAERAFELGGQALDGRKRDARRELGGDDGPFRRSFAIIVRRPRCSDLEADKGCVRVFVSCSWRELLRCSTELRAVLCRRAVAVLHCVEVFDFELKEALIPP